MTDRTGGPSLPNHAYSLRPEDHEEEHGLGSEGKDAGIFKAASGARNDEEDERLQRQDLTLARNLRLRTERLEKVVTSILEHPHMIDDDNTTTPPRSPSSNPPSICIPRLPLDTIINDLFAHQAPHPAYRHIHPSPPKTELAPPTPIPGRSRIYQSTHTTCPSIWGILPQPQQPHPIAPYRYTAIFLFPFPIVIHILQIPTHVPFNSFSTHHSPSTSQHGATSQFPENVRDRPTSLLGMVPPSSWPSV